MSAAAPLCLCHQRTCFTAVAVVNLPLVDVGWLLSLGCLLYRSGSRRFAALPVSAIELALQQRLQKLPHCTCQVVSVIEEVTLR